jgi:hypothetical protein
MTVPHTKKQIRGGINMQATARPPEWEEKTNAIYQDCMRTVLNLATASLVLPIVLVRTFAVGGVPKEHLTRRAYVSWFFLFLSMVLSLFFFLAPAKFVKLIYGGTECLDEIAHKYCASATHFENLRDWTAILSVLSFALGLVHSFLFLRNLMASKPSLGQSPAKGSE